jgi:hypothetical protein
MTRFGVLLGSLLVALTLAAPAGAAPIRTGVFEPVYFGDPAKQVAAFDRTRAAGGTVAKMVLEWRQVAPSSRPIDPRNHLAYNWSGFDRQVQLAAERGLTPLVTVMFAPPWAEGAGGSGSGIYRPNPDEFGHFAFAAASRYSGLLPGLPRVRYWQAWSEPNRDYFFMPQFEGRRMVSPAWYRTMVRKFADGIHQVSQSNVIVAGGLAPLGRPGKPAPLAFMRSMLCLTKTLGRACDLRGNKIPVDVWSHHPYTSGGPTHSALAKDDVALGDLPDMRRVLRAAIRLGHVRSDGPVGFWVTEFSWDTKPPDPQGLSSSLHARWTSEALYRMWQNGVGLVTWFRIMDDPLSSSYFQSGLYTVDGHAKRSKQAYRFPVVALTRTGGIYVWGRTPTTAPGSVVVEVKSGRSWRRLGTLRAGSGGIFQKTYRTPTRRGYVRARFAGEASVPFSLTYVRDRFVNPFGCGGSIPC